MYYVYIEQSGFNQIRLFEIKIVYTSSFLSNKEIFICLYSNLRELTVSARHLTSGLSFLGVHTLKYPRLAAYE
jgi:hypothetical protein